jgi:CheY-like chemotaxis protein
MPATRQPPLPVAPLKPHIVVCDPTGEVAPLLTRYADGVEFSGHRNLHEAGEELGKSGAQALLINTESPLALHPLMERARSGLPDVPVIGFSLPPKVEHALAAGAQGYLLKPVSRDDLAAALRSTGVMPRRVLIVDDDADARSLFSRMVRACDESIEIETAGSGEEALAAMREDQPDLVLLDIILPDSDGWQVLGLKRADETIKDIPVIFLSAQDPRQQPLQSGILMAAMGQGLSVSQILQSIQTLSAILRQRGAQPAPEP